jgi:hypothetical protein
MFMPAIRATLVPQLALALLVPGVFADNPNNTIPTNDLAVPADLFN